MKLWTRVDSDAAAPYIGPMSRIILFLTVLLLVSPATFAEEAGTAPVRSQTPMGVPALAWQAEASAPSSTDAVKGRPVILHFWATWCAPCVKELPQLAALADAYQRKDIVFVPLSLDAQAQKVDAFYREQNIFVLPIALDTGMASYRALKLKGLPSTVFIDRQGREVARIDGAVDWNHAKTREMIDALLAEKL